MLQLTPQKLVMHDNKFYSYEELEDRRENNQENEKEDKYNKNYESVEEKKISI